MHTKDTHAQGKGLINPNRRPNATRPGALGTSPLDVSGHLTGSALHQATVTLTLPVTRNPVLTPIPEPNNPDSNLQYYQCQPYSNTSNTILHSELR